MSRNEPVATAVAVDDRARQLQLLCIASFASMAAMRACDPMLVVLSAEFGSSLGGASKVVSAYAVTYGVLQLFYGPLGDRIGKLQVVRWASLGCAVACALVALAPTLGLMVGARALMGAAAAGIIPLAMAWIGDTVAYGERQETLARLLGAIVIGLVAGQWLGAWVTDLFGWRWVFWALLAVFGGVAYALKASPNSQQAVGCEGAPSAPSWAAAWAAPIALLRSDRVRWVLAVTTAEGALAFGLLAFIPSLLIERFGLSITAAGSVLLLYGVGGLVYTRGARFWVRKLGERGLALTGGLLLGGAMGLLAAAADWRLALPACFFAGVGFYMLHSTLQVQATQMAPAQRGTAVSLFSGMLFFGQAIGVLAMAWAFDHGRSQLMFAAAGGAAFLLALLVRRGVARGDEPAR